jgi:uncharacterized protein (UPF0335 family)
MAQAHSAEQLRKFIERIESLEKEKQAITDDIKLVYGEAKSEGFDPKTMRTVIRLRAMDRNDRQEQEAILEMYKGALGLT